MNVHPTPTAAASALAPERLDVRLLRFRNRSDVEEPALLALELVSAGRVYDALEVVDLALERDPDDIDLLLGCGVAAAQAGQLAFAQLVLTRAAKRAPEWVEPLRWLARVLAMRGQHARAIEVARRALAAGDCDPEIVAMVRRDDRRRELDARIAAFEADPDRDDPALLAAALLAEERADDALAVARAALAREEDADLRFVEARALLALGRREEAEAVLGKLVTRAPDWEEPARLLGQLRLERGALIEAIEVVEQALSASPAHEELRRLRERIEQAMSGAGIERSVERGATFEELLATRHADDPDGERSLRELVALRTLVGEEATSDVPSPGRGARLLRVARHLFGLEVRDLERRAALGA